MTDEERALQQAEAQVSAQETELAADEAKLALSALQLTTRLDGVKAATQRARNKGVEDRALADVQARLNDVKITPLELSAELLQTARDLRAKAVKARQRLLTAKRTALTSQSEQLARVSSQLVIDVAILENMARAARKRAIAAVGLTPPLPPVEAYAPEPEEIDVLPEADPPSAAFSPPEPLRLNAELDASSDSNFFIGFSTEVGVAGLFIATLEPVSVGREVDVSFKLPGNGPVPLRARGIVRWIRELNDDTWGIFPGVGVELLDLSEAANDAIAGFVKMREPLFYPD